MIAQQRIGHNDNEKDKLMVRSFVHPVLFLIVTLMIISCGGDSEKVQVPQNTQPSANAASQKQAPAGAFAFEAYDTDGVLQKSTQWVGQQPTVLNFWGTWCPPCRMEIPDLKKVYDEFQPLGVEMLGLAVKDNPETVDGFVRKNKMNWVMLMATQDLAVRYRISGVPTTIFLDRSGKELRRFVGPQSYETFKKAFELILQS